jgi:hypothetical protein
MPHNAEWAGYAGVMNDIHRYVNGNWYLGSFYQNKTDQNMDILAMQMIP